MRVKLARARADGVPGAEKAVHQSRLLVPEGSATGGGNALAIGLAVRRQRVALGGDDDRRRQIGEIAVGQRRHGDVAGAILAAGADAVVEMQVAQRQHRRLGVPDIGAARLVAAKAGIDQHLAGRMALVAARRVADGSGEIAAGTVAGKHDGQVAAGNGPFEG